MSNPTFGSTYLTSLASPSPRKAITTLVLYSNSGLMDITVLGTLPALKWLSLHNDPINSLRCSAAPSPGQRRRPAHGLLSAPLARSRRSSAVRVPLKMLSSAGFHDDWFGVRSDG